MFYEAFFEDERKIQVLFFRIDKKYKKFLWKKSIFEKICVHYSILDFNLDLKGGYYERKKC